MLLFTEPSEWHVFRLDRMAWNLRSRGVRTHEKRGMSATFPNRTTLKFPASLLRSIVSDLASPSAAIIRKVHKSSPSIGHLLVYGRKERCAAGERASLCMMWHGRCVCFVSSANPLSPSKRLAPSLALEKSTGQKLTNGLCNVSLFEGRSIYKANAARLHGDKHTNTSNTGITKKQYHYFDTAYFWKGPTKNGRFPYDEQKPVSAESVLLILHKTSLDCRNYSLYAKRKIINFNWH